MLIRQITRDDAAAAAQLSAEFGYPVTADVIEQRIRALASLESHVVFVATLDDIIVGWIDVGIVHHLQSEPYGEIGGFVVTQSHRGGGIGRELLNRAETWIRERGIHRALVRSQLMREAAHRFYKREGYSQVKTSAVFEKQLPQTT